MKKQEGFVLVITMILLTMMSLMAATAYNMSSAEQLIQYNSKAYHGATAAAQQAIERSVNNIESFTSPAAITTTINGYQVTMPPAACIGAKKVGGFSARTGVMFNETHWVLEATAYDPTSQAKTTITQGVRMRMPMRDC